MAAILNIDLPRNADYYQRWQVTDNEGAAIDLTGHTFELNINTAAGVGGSPIATATFSERDDADGSFDVLIEGADFASVGGAMEVVRLHHDFRITDTTGIATRIATGAVNLLPGDD